MRHIIPGYPIGTRISLAYDFKLGKSDITAPAGSLGWIVAEPWAGCWGDRHPPTIVLDEYDSAYGCWYLEFEDVHQ
jgi:hypothetical protein